jgi:hypothetical protein
MVVTTTHISRMTLAKATGTSKFPKCSTISLKKRLLNHRKILRSRRKSKNRITKRRKTSNKSNLLSRKNRQLNLTTTCVTFQSLTQSHLLSRIGLNLTILQCDQSCLARFRILLEATVTTHTCSYIDRSH